MSKRVAVVIGEDPTKTHRPVEALRIALGLCAGDHETTIVLLGRARLLLTDDTEDVVDVDILEKYRPSLAQLAVPFVIESGTATDALLEEFSVTQKSPEEIRSMLQSFDRTLVFS
jgi:sulfur relay (sulfurtransferase) DsrF/TusC family protein